MLAIGSLARTAAADVISFGGTILQSTGDGTGPAVNNPGLNSILDGDAYTVQLDLAGSGIVSITAPGTYTLTGGSLAFNDPGAASSETSFGLISLTITADSGFLDFSLLGCLTTGTDCLSGNQLTGNLQISAAGLHSQNVAATGLDQPHPLDLLEDDGVTDLHGSITEYTYTGTGSTVPEPSSFVLLGGALAALGWRLNRREGRIV